jgi:hypothetical protein
VKRTVTGFVLGYHGCDRSVAERLIAGEPFQASSNNYDWLGAGVYFWEGDPARAMQWAEKIRTRTGKITDPAVVGAVIDLGLCLDLTTQSSLDVTRSAHDGLAKIMLAAGETMPTNIDELRRPLDCAVLNYLFESMPDPKFQTARGMFVEGGPLYPGAFIQSETHVQIAVRDPTCIRGVFTSTGGP